MRRALSVLFVMVMVVATVPAQEKQPYTFEDHIAMKRLSGPALSPDGAWIAYSQTEYSLETNSGATSIYLIPSTGGEPLFFAEGSSPVWSPDGTHIVFSRGGQLWLISMEGGEARQITDIATGAGGAVWSPDSSKILFSSMVWPGMNEEENAKKLADMEASKVTAIPTDNLLFRHWNTWRTDGRKSHLFLLDVATGEYHDLMPDFAYDIPPFPFGGSSDYSFAPDGKEIAFVAKTAENPAWNTNLDVFTLDLESGEMKNITEANKAQDSGPVAYSPDGTYLAYGAMERPNFEADRIQLTIYDRTSRMSRKLTGDLDSSASGWSWLPDGSGLVFTAQDHGAETIYSVNMSGDVTEVLKGHTNRSVAVGPNGEQLWYAKQSLSAPVDIYMAAIDGSGETQLTFANKERLDSIEMSRVEEEYFEGANGHQVQMFILYPPGFDPDKKYPAVVLIHGGPQGVFGDDFHYRWNAQLFAAPGYVTTCINFHGSTSFGQDFTDSISKNWGGLPFIDIMKGTEYLAAKPFVDGERIGAAGGSYGGYLVNWIATQTDRFSALISHAGVFNAVSMYGATEELWFPEWEFGGPYWENMEHYRRWSPHFHAKGLATHGTPVLVIHGEHDYRVPYTQSFELFTALQRQGVSSRLLHYPDETHFVVKPQNARLWYKEVHDWFARWLSPESE